MPARVDLSDDVVNRIVQMYCAEHKNISSISRELSISDKVIRRIISAKGIDITMDGKFYRTLTDDTKNKISNKLKGRVGTRRGKKMTQPQRYNNMRAQLRITADLSKYTDFEKLKYITRWITRAVGARNVTEQYILSFIDKFYNDNKFNVLYDRWMDTKDKWIQPTLDHIIPKSRGGTWDISNLQALTWFENKAKAEMTQDEWTLFKQKYKISGDIL